MKYLSRITLVLFALLVINCSYKKEFFKYKINFKDWKFKSTILLPYKPKDIYYSKGTIGRSYHFIYNDSSKIDILFYPDTLTNVLINNLYLKIIYQKDVFNTTIDSVISSNRKLYCGSLINGRFWKEIQNKYIYLAYYNVKKESLFIFEKSLDSFTIIKKGVSHNSE